MGGRLFLTEFRAYGLRAQRFGIRLRSWVELQNILAFQALRLNVRDELESRKHCHPKDGASAKACSVSDRVWHVGTLPLGLGCRVRGLGFRV